MRTWMLLLSLPLLLGVGCGAAESEDEESDSELYVEALQRPPLVAAEVCAELDDAGLRGDCKTAIAIRLVQAGDRAAAEGLCDGISDPVWQDECWFSVADTAALTGPDAARLCARSRRYEVHCRKHALEREAFAMPLDVGAEAEGIVEMGRMVHVLQPRAKQKARRLMANRLLGKRVSMRWAEVPFDPSLCGVMTPGLCRYAYWYTVSHLRGEIATVCQQGQPTTSEATVAGGMSGFTPAGAAIAQAVWAETCAEVAAGRADPQEIGALEPSLAELDMMVVRPPPR